MTHATNIFELFERIERLKQVNDEQAAALTACQDENYKVFAQNRELVRRVKLLEYRNTEILEDNARMSIVVVNHLGEQDG